MPRADTDPDFMKRGPTGAQTRSYADRKVAETNAKATVAVSGIESTASIMRELISASKANPMVGVFLVAVGTDVLGQAGIIRPSTEQWLFRALGVAFGIEVAVEATSGIVSILDALDPFKSNGSPTNDPADLIKPVPTTMVENPEATHPAPPPPGALGLTALLPKVIPEVPVA